MRKSVGTFLLDPKLPEKLLTPRQVAEILGLSVTTLAIWRSRGTPRLPYIKVGRLVMYEPSAIENFIQEHRVENEVKDTGS